MRKRYGIAFDTDTYKVTQDLQYPPGTKSMFSYIESRGGLFPATQVAGLQYYVKEYLTEPTTMEDVEEAKEMFMEHVGYYNYEGWKHIVDEHDGLLPMRIRAVPEGLVIPTHQALVTVESTDEQVPWINTWSETSLMRNTWSGTNVGTISYNAKKIIKAALDKSSDDPENEILFKLHDFGSRGVSSQESAMIGGGAHLINFRGTDTTVALRYLKDYYNAKKMPAFSIPAMEHSTVTSWGRYHETNAYSNMLDKFAKPGAMLACVLDSYDIENAITHIIGGTLKQKIIDSGAVIVCRPDSGIPHEIDLKSIQLLDQAFGHTINTKGYKVLNYVRLIQGDGVNLTSIQKILDVLLGAGYSATNIAFGMGGALLQQHNRDTQRFAMKCSHIYRSRNEILDTEPGLTFTSDDLVGVKVFKDPITDPGKASKSGRLDLILDNGVYRTIELEEGQIAHPKSVMRIIYENGKLMVDDTLDNIRARAILL